MEKNCHNSRLYIREKSGGRKWGGIYGTQYPAAAAINEERKVFSMQAQNFMRVEEVAQELGISKSHAYKVIHKLNAELREKGYLTISGRVNRNFFMEKFCYGKTGKEG